MDKEPDFEGWTTIEGIRSGDLREPPKELIEMIKTLKYKEGWSFAYDFWHLIVRIECEDSTGRYVQIKPQEEFRYDSFGNDREISPRFLMPDQPFYTVHTINIPSSVVFCDSIPLMRRWLLDQIVAIETHEACEFFKLPNECGDYYVPFFPHSEDHGPYAIVDKTGD